MSAGRDRETRQAEAREEIADELAHWPIGSGYYGVTVPSDVAGEMADAVLALPALRAVRDGDALRRDLAALVEEWDQSHDWTDAAARIRDLLDGGEGGR